MSQTKYDSLIEHYQKLYPSQSNTELARTITYDESLFSIGAERMRRYIGDYKKRKASSKPQGFYSVNLGCYHIPFHDKKQWEATLYLIDFMATHYVTDLNLVGDMMDMNSISRHGKGKKAKVEGLTLTSEYASGNKELDKLEGMPIRNKRYFYGNHENWYYVHMSEIDNAKLGEGAIKSPAEALHLEERGFEVFKDYIKDQVKIGDLVLTHGSYFNTHAAQKHLEAYKQNVLFFHTHRMQSFTDSGQDETITAYNAGCGVSRWEKAFDYADQATRRKWEQGISVTYTDELGHTHVDMLHWKNERFVFMGHEFTADGVKPLLK